MSTKLTGRVEHLDCKKGFNACLESQSQRYLYKESIIGSKDSNLLRHDPIVKDRSYDNFATFDFETYNKRCPNKESHMAHKTRSCGEECMERIHIPYLLVVRHPRLGRIFIRRCDYEIHDLFYTNPFVYVSFNGAGYDHLILNAILSEFGKTDLWREGSEIRVLRFGRCKFIDIRYYDNPFGSLSQFSKTWLQKDLKDIFPHEAVVEGMVKDKNSKFGVIAPEDFGDKVEVSQEDCDRFSNRPFWPLVEEYAVKDVDILYEGTLKLEEQYKSLGYSILTCAGIASMALDFTRRCFPLSADVRPATRELYDLVKGGLTGGITEVFDLNLGQETIHEYDIRGM
jgi:hypothetical protein